MKAKAHKHVHGPTLMKGVSMAKARKLCSNNSFFSTSSVSLEVFLEFQGLLLFYTGVTVMIYFFKKHESDNT